MMDLILNNETIVHEMQRSLDSLAGISTKDSSLEQLQSARRIQADALATHAAESVTNIAKQIDDHVASIKHMIDRQKQRFDAYLEYLRVVKAVEIVRSKTPNLRSEHRSHDGLTGKGKKSSTKKSSKAASGGDGGGDGDGDGPPHKRAKKQRIRVKNRNVVPSLPPSAPTGAVVQKTLSKTPNWPSRANILVSILSVISLGYRSHVGLDLSESLAMIFVFILGLGGLGMKNLATRVWDSVPKLLSRLSPGPTDES
jgi:hypothetical protein